MHSRHLGAGAYLPSCAGAERSAETRGPGCAHRSWAVQRHGVSSCTGLAPLLVRPGMAMQLVLPVSTGDIEESWLGNLDMPIQGAKVGWWWRKYRSLQRFPSNIRHFCEYIRSFSGRQRRKHRMRGKYERFRARAPDGARMPELEYRACRRWLPIASRLNLNPLDSFRLRAILPIPSCR